MAELRWHGLAVAVVLVVAPSACDDPSWSSEAACRHSIACDNDIPESEVPAEAIGPCAEVLDSGFGAPAVASCVNECLATTPCDVLPYGYEALRYCLNDGPRCETRDPTYH